MERALIQVDVGECRCPGHPHTTDWVKVTPTLTVELGSAVMAAIRAGGSDSVRIQGLMGQAYVMFGIRAWSFLDEDGDPVRVQRSEPEWPDIIDQYLPWSGGGKEVITVCDDLYSEEVLRPLTSLPPTLSPDGPTVGSTSPIRPSGGKPQTPSGRSLRPDTAGKQYEDQEP